MSALLFQNATRLPTHFCENRWAFWSDSVAHWAAKYTLLLVWEDSHHEKYSYLLYICIYKWCKPSFIVQLTCSPVTSSVSGWNVRRGCAWFSDSHTAFSWRFTNEYGKYCNWFPDTSKTCNWLQFPSSAGKTFSLLSLKLRTPNFVQLPISIGKLSNEFLSTFKLFSFVMQPIDGGSSIKKFSVKINSCI